MNSNSSYLVDIINTENEEDSITKILDNTNPNPNQKMQNLKLIDGTIVSKEEFIKTRTKELREFGYFTITEKEMEAEVNKVINQESGLSIIGRFIKNDFELVK